MSYAAVSYHISPSFFSTSSMDRPGCSPLILGWNSEQNRRKVKRGFLGACLWEILRKLWEVDGSIWVLLPVLLPTSLHKECIWWLFASWLLRILPLGFLGSPLLMLSYFSSARQESPSAHLALICPGTVSMELKIPQSLSFFPIFNVAITNFFIL